MQFACNFNGLMLSYVRFDFFENLGKLAEVFLGLTVHRLEGIDRFPEACLVHDVIRGLTFA